MVLCILPSLYRTAPLSLCKGRLIINFRDDYDDDDKMLRYGRETALQGALVFAKRGRLDLGDNILRTL